MNPAAPSAPEPRPPAPASPPSLLQELRRKAIHLAFLVLPISLLHPLLPWPRSHREFVLLFLLLVAGAVALDLLRIHEPRVRTFFRRFLGGLIREHEHFGLLGSTYLLIATLLAIEIFPRPVAAAAVGYTVLGDAFAAIVGRAWGRTRLFHKSLEGLAGCLVACLAWGAVVAGGGYLPWTVAVAGAWVASLVELLPIPLDDNLGITLCAGYAMKLLLP